jgi:hypothetical protein
MWRGNLNFKKLFASMVCNILTLLCDSFMICCVADRRNIPNTFFAARGIESPRLVSEPFLCVYHSFQVVKFSLIRILCR